jgi:hypothetical protein
MDKDYSPKEQAYLDFANGAETILEVNEIGLVIYGNKGNLKTYITAARVNDDGIQEVAYQEVSPVFYDFLHKYLEELDEGMKAWGRKHGDKPRL